MDLSRKKMLPAYFPYFGTLFQFSPVDVLLVGPINWTGLGRRSFLLVRPKSQETYRGSLWLCLHRDPRQIRMDWRLQSPG